MSALLVLIGILVALMCLLSYDIRMFMSEVLKTIVAASCILALATAGWAAYVSATGT